MSPERPRLLDAAQLEPLALYKEEKGGCWTLPPPPPLQQLFWRGVTLCSSCAVGLRAKDEVTSKEHSLRRPQSPNLTRPTFFWTQRDLMVGCSFHSGRRSEVSHRHPRTQEDSSASHRAQEESSASGSPFADFAASFLGDGADAQPQCSSFGGAGAG